MDTLRTPDERFEDLDAWPYAPTYVEVDRLRIHVVDEGPRDADPVLLLHGEPTWSYLYRDVIAGLVDRGHRVVAPDLVGFGRSDKPTEVTDHTYARHVAWMRGVVEALDLRRTTLVAQDWGGLIGLRVLAEDPARFSRVVVANTGLPTGEQRMSAAWVAFRDWMASATTIRVSDLVRGGCARPVSDDAARAYDAPFPDARYLAGVRAMPALVPTTPDAPGAAENRRAWEVLEQLDLPLLTAFSDGDPITAGGDRRFRERIPGAQGQPHTTIEDAGHFLQEDAGADLAATIDTWRTA